MAHHDISDTALAQILAALRLMQENMELEGGETDDEQQRWVRGRILEYFEEDTAPYTIRQIEALCIDLNLGNPV